MSFIGMLGAQVGSAAIGQGMGMLDEALFGNRRRRKQLEQQQKLTDINVAAQEGLMDKAQEQQLEMWDATNYAAQMEQLRKAGLNPALIYAGGGGQGTTGTIGGGGVGAGTASTEAEQKQAEAAQQGMGLQMAKLAAEVKVMEAQAKKLEADAKLSSEQGITEEQKREIFIENMKQSGMAEWLKNLRKQIEHGGGLQDGEVQLYRNKVYDASTAFENTGIWHQRETTAIAESMARTGSAEAQALLNNEKAKIVWGELLNAIKIGDAIKMQAEAQKLATEWSTGEFTNWKTWVDVGKEAITLIFDGVKTFTPAGKVTNIESMTKNINLPKR